MTTTPNQVSVVIPMYNEAENVEPFIREVNSALEGLMFEIIVVNDGSNDATLAKLKALQAEIPVLRVINHKNNFGQSASIVTGVHHAKFDWVATLDGDGQNDPHDIPNLLDRADNPKNLIAGFRKKRDDSWLKKFSSRVANKVRSTLLKDKCPDTGCGLKVFAKNTFLTLPHFNHLHRFLPALYYRQAGDVIMIEVNHRPRTRGQSKYGVMNRLWVGIVDMFGMIWLIRRPCRPETERGQTPP